MPDRTTIQHPTAPPDIDAYLAQFGWHPEPELMRKRLVRFGVSLPIRGPAPAELVVRIASPNGVVELRSGRGGRPDEGPLR